MTSVKFILQIVDDDLADLCVVCFLLLFADVVFPLNSVPLGTLTIPTSTHECLDVSTLVRKTSEQDE